MPVRHLRRAGALGHAFRMIEAAASLPEVWLGVITHDPAEGLRHLHGRVAHWRVGDVMDVEQLLWAARELRDRNGEIHRLFGEGLAEWSRRYASTVCQRFESVRETLFCYTDNADSVIAALQHAPALRYVHRPSNLEDVFLKLTGRDLRD